MKERTLVSHPPDATPAPSNKPVVSPIYQSVKFTFENVEQVEQYLRGETPGYIYSRKSNPTVHQLELLLAKLQGCEDAIVTSTGVSALATALLGTLEVGAHLVLLYDCYCPTRRIVRTFLSRYGVTSTFLAVHDYAGLERAIEQENVRAVMVESLTNPMLRILDVERILELIRGRNITLICDNTLSGLHSFRQYPIDLYVHSLTKYASGHGDVLGGAVIGDTKLLNKIRGTTDLGYSLDANSAFLILRGLKTYFVRYEKQCEQARAVAQFLSEQKQVKQLFYPGLPSHPDYALAQTQFSDPGTLITFDLEGGKAEARQFMNALKIFNLTFSLGATESIVSPAKLFFSPDLSARECDVVGITDSTIRLSIGLEDLDDLLNDLRGAFATFTT